MPRPSLRHIAAAAAWLALAVLGCVVLARGELARLREGFETDARIVHRLLSQRAVQHDAVLASLALLQPADGAGRPEQRLASVYPQILGIERRASGAAWSDPRLAAAEAQSRARQRPVLAGAELAVSRYQLVLAAEPASFALNMDLRAAVPWAEWPMAADSSPVRVALDYGGQQFLLQPGRRVGDGGWRFDFRKQLATDSQPFDVIAARQVGWGELPWVWMVAWCLAVTLAAAALLALSRARGARQRAEELVRLGRVGRLNALGELAAGMAHELNQPLTAVLANNQAASRLLQQDPPDLATARAAIEQAVEQSRRATEVIGRLRRAVERPGVAGQMQPVPLQDAMRNVLYLLEPEFKRCQLAPRLQADAGAVVMAEPVALEQIIYNLVTNALQSLEQVPAGQRELTVELARRADMGVLTLTDSGAGIAADALPRVFEPFFSTRANGLGLGLSLCETLAQGMGGALAAERREPRGARFRLSLPLAPA